MDEQQPAVRSALAFIDDTPHFELKADELKIRIGVADAKRFLCVHLRPYTPAEMKETLGALKVRVRDAGTSLIQEEGDPSALRRLCDVAFLRLSHVRMPDGGEPTAEQQRAWFDQNPGMKSRVANDAFASVILLGPPSPKGAKDDVFELVLKDSDQVEYLLANLANDAGETVVIPIKHVFEPDTESDFQIYERASRREIDKTSGFAAVDLDYDALEKLYDRTIVNVDGMVIDGAPCTQYNKAKWAPLVPFWQKIIALNTRFQELLKKNIA